MIFKILVDKFFLLKFKCCGDWDNDGDFKYVVINVFDVDEFLIEIILLGWYW